MPPSTAKITASTAAFAALGDPTRMSIVRRLSDLGPLPTVSLVDGAKQSRQGITKHLRALEQAGLVRGDRIGRDCVWTLRKPRLAEICGYLDEIAAQWDDALVRLRAAVEE